MKQLKQSNEELGALCFSLANLLHAGIGTGDAFGLMARDESRSEHAHQLDEMARMADEGAGLGQIFEEQGCFPGYLCRLLKVADRVGRTEQILAGLGEHYENRARMEARLRVALLYPALLLAVMLAVVAVLLIWVLPVFDDVYVRLGSGLTGLAGGLLTLGRTLRSALPLLCVLAGGAVVAVLLYGLCPTFARAVSGIWRAWRADKGVNGRINAARFLQATAMGLVSGMTRQQAGSLNHRTERNCCPPTDWNWTCREDCCTCG